MERSSHRAFSTLLLCAVVIFVLFVLSTFVSGIQGSACSHSSVLPKQSTVEVVFTSQASDYARSTLSHGVVLVKEAKFICRIWLFSISSRFKDVC
ncbi:uncharacterized protein EI97DRAFT_436315 [Westerdykella ornata]|uniref:Uncharacterized protein n=1 Tax=Westerdykella ornata TaxID=318751 RepID=A0A6A6JA74_WESOR|nr:uncharacterized protein EI97DRAFT_436315 [Westerdykella ornata]KAF2273073.1 hypothetical protein EI97DRAFT_436315 [Westerdykella ornata]